ncbi:MAG: DNA internalization-related competence protein ComEC/Rec2 [Roseburia sp.]|nr:DNA internalization-related competence protein ComEC/Rec2 [Roseburia sp.]
MNKRKLASCLVSFLLGTVGVVYHYPAILLVFMGYLIWQHHICAAGGIAVAKRKIYVIILLAAFFVGGVRAGVRERQSILAQSFFHRGDKVTLLGNLSQKEQKAEQFYYYLKDSQINSNEGTYTCPKILVILDSDFCSIGETLFIKGKVKTFKEPENEGGYNEKSYYQSLNIEVAIEEASVEKSFGGRNLFLESLCQIRRKLSGSYENCMKESHANVMAAMTLGEKSGMDRELKALYQKAGVSHFYCISGIHLSILGMTLYRLLRKKSTCITAAVLAGGLVCCYLCLTGFGISQTRAMGMFLILLYGKCRGRSYDLLTSLCVLASLMVWENPMILYHSGFLLSFGAVAGVLLAGEIKKNCFLGELSGIRDTLLVSICIQLVTLPVLCNSFYEISLYATLVNLFILPCMGILLGLGMAGMLAGCMSVIVGKILLFPCTLILLFFEAVSRFSIRLPFAVVITGKLSVGRIFFWYGCILFLVLWKKKKNYIVRVIAGTVLCGILIACPVFRKTEWDVLDVGQGDGICFMEKDGTVMFLDGGSTSVSKVGTYRILPFLKYHGVRHMDYWFLSHLDEDHINGMIEVAESGFPIHCLVLAEGIVRDDAWQDLMDFADDKDIPILYMKQGSVLQGEMESWEITCLYPEDRNEETDRNNASMVLFYESGEIRGLFTGDLSAEQERRLAEEYELSRADVLKVSHHGSRFGTCEELLTASSPRAAIISCGRNNIYGHPGEETLQRLLEAGTAVFDTRFAGQIKIREGKISCSFKRED